MNANAFAQDWIASWNSHNIERILEHYSEDVIFDSPLVRTVNALARSSRIRGKATLREYWSNALRKYPDLSFQLLAVMQGANALCLIYNSVQDQIAVEWMNFNEDGLITSAAAAYCHATSFPLDSMSP